MAIHTIPEILTPMVTYTSMAPGGNMVKTPEGEHVGGLGSNRKDPQEANNTHYLEAGKQQRQPVLENMEL